MTGSLFDAALHKVESCSNNGWDDEPEWVLICACGWETWGATEEWIVRDRHDEHMIDEFKNWRKAAGDSWIKGYAEDCLKLLNEIDRLSAELRREA